MLICVSVCECGRADLCVCVCVCARGCVFVLLCQVSILVTRCIYQLSPLTLLVTVHSSNATLTILNSSVPETCVQSILLTVNSGELVKKCGLVRPR